MIKVIAVDMDGTLLNENHEITPRTASVIKRAQKLGMRVVIATGRFKKGALGAIDGRIDNVDLLLNSGAEVEDRDGHVLGRHPISWPDLRAVAAFFEKYPEVGLKYNGFEKMAFIGTEDDFIQKALQDARIFNAGKTDEEILANPDFGPRQMMENTNMFPNFETLEQNMEPIAKVFCFGAPADRMVAIKEQAAKELPQLAVASSFPTNIEITSLAGQKGPALKEFIESLGYTMDEVIIFGDSLNDLSMMEMDFHTVAMANADEEIKRVAKYMTKSNAEEGVAWAIEQLLDADFYGLSAKK